MATLSANAPVTVVEGTENSIGIIADDIVYEGAMVGDNASGYGRPLVAGDPFCGHAIKKVDNTGGGAGDKQIRLRGGRYRLKVALAIALTNLGDSVYASDDAILTLTADTNTLVGVVTRYIDAEYCEVEFRPNP